VLLNGRGLDGMGMPVEVIDVPCLVGSGRTCTIWVNAPGIETRHAVITQGDEGWVIEDLGSERGTFLNGERIARKVLVTGDSFLLAGYLAMRVELR
jgi:pSer/pThr/pTyr-binding forkhead associated (FHA) protein